MNIDIETITFENPLFTTNFDGSNVNIGFDREYDSHEKPVTTQLYLKNHFPDETSNYSVFEELIGVRIIEKGGTVFVFNDLNTSVGIPYCRKFSKRLLEIQKFFSLKITKKVTCHTFYSNAEISGFFSVRNDLKELMELQGDTQDINKPRYQKNKENLFLMDIGGSIVLKNYHLELPFSVDILDAKHIFTQSNLKDLGAGLNMNKIEGFDFEKKKASEYLLESKKEFITYAAIDAVIPTEAVLSMYQSKNDLALKLCDMNILPPKTSKEIKGFLAKNHLTAASISDHLIYLCVTQQGLKKDFQNFQYFEEMRFPNEAKKTKGGLNKAFVKTPVILRNVDQFDISGAYATAMREFKLPTNDPIVVGSRKIKAKDLAKKLDNDNISHAVYNLEFELDQNTNEWERPLVIIDHKNNLGFTGSKTDKKQWYILTEIQTLATIHPDLNLNVNIGFNWVEQGDFKSISLNGLYTALKQLRSEYKKQGETGQSMQLTIKLIGNAGYGKLLQNKEVLDSGLVHDSILTNSVITESTHKISSKSKNYSSIWGNAVTGIVRSVLAITAWKNSSQMAVTDSILCKTGSFISSKEIITPYNKLNKWLHSFDWECDFQNVCFFLCKERDYFSFRVKNMTEEEFFSKIETEGISDDTINFMDVLKAAKRGYKAVSKDKQEKNIEFAKKSIHRLNGEPIHFEERKLIKFREFLLHSKKLNEQVTTHKSLGSENLRYNCDSIEELQNRTLVKDKCRRLNFADGLHCKLEDPLLYDKIKKNTNQPRVQPQYNIPSSVKRALFELIDRNYSYRDLETFLRENNIEVAKTTLNRWYKQHNISNISTLRVNKTRFKPKLDNIKLKDLQKNDPKDPFVVIKNFILSREENSHVNNDEFFENL